MTSFLLPHHIIICIFQNLCHQGDYKTIVSFSQICRSVQKTYTATFHERTKHYHALQKISNMIRNAIERGPCEDRGDSINIQFNAHKIQLRVTSFCGFWQHTKQWILQPYQQEIPIEIVCHVDAPSSLCLTDFVELAHALKPTIRNQPRLQAVQAGNETSVSCMFSISGRGQDFGHTETEFGYIPHYPDVFQLLARIKIIMDKQWVGSVNSPYIACM